MATAWIVDDDHAIRWVLERTLKSENIEYASFPDGECLWQQLQIEQPEVIISDVRMPGIDGLALMERIHEQFPLLPIIIMTAHSDLDSAVNAYQSGAFEYLPKPFDIHEAISLIQRAINHSLELKQKRKAPEATVSMPEIIGEAPAMQEVFRIIGRLSRSSMSVLINGQSGTGKELVAHALHKHSPRKDKTFIALNMAAIPRELIEAELFGHEKGAFTGAASNRQGRFEQADGGTLFLDEIGDMPLDVQTRLLRVLADGQFYRVGLAKASGEATWSVLSGIGFFLMLLSAILKPEWVEVSVFGMPHRVNWPGLKDELDALLQIVRKTRTTKRKV